jgi:hypothetical protein
MKEEDLTLKLVNGVLDDLLDYNCEPESIELAHIVTESFRKAHPLTELCPKLLFLEALGDLIIRQR